ncbi:MFS transporter [Verrucosispora sp. WMMD1129]|nr:MFS transporter [Verrucosispora sp. WMMD1129]WFE48616.1 MFS transporter [Verrucosispora sp. WMMD1129]
MFRERESRDRLVEVYFAPSWDKHLREHGGRLSRTDREAEDRAWSTTERQPAVRHLLPAAAQAQS